MLLNDEKKKEKERCEHQGKLTTLKINSNQLLIEIKKRKQEVFMLKTSLEKVKKDVNHSENKTRECVEMKECNKALNKRIGRHEANKKKLENEVFKHREKSRHSDENHRELLKDFADRLNLAKIKNWRKIYQDHFNE